MSRLICMFLEVFLHLLLVREQIIYLPSISFPHSEIQVPSTVSDFLFLKFRNFRENFIFANSVKNLFVTLKLATSARFTYISKRQSDFAISQNFLIYSCMALQQQSVHW